MKITAFISLIFTSFFSLAELAYLEIDLFDEKRLRPVKISAWYHAGSPCERRICLDLSADQSEAKIAIVSHGAFGSPREMNWLGYGIAKQGWLVLGVAHHGESWVYGKSSINYSIVSKKWLRAQDLSFVLDQLFHSNSLINREVDKDSIVIAGHSLGGYSALSLAGVRQDMKAMVAYCKNAMATDKGCRYGYPNKESSLSSNLIPVNLKDERVNALILLDPALGPLASQSSLKQVILPTLIIGSVENDFLNYEAHAGYYASLIKDAQLVKLATGEGHFVYLDQCQHEHKVMGTSLCEDRQNVDRAEVHSRLLAEIIRFIDGL